MLNELKNSNVAVSREEIQNFCARYGIELPRAYVQYLLRNNGGVPVPSVFRIDGFLNNPTGQIQAFFGLNASISAEDLNFVLREFAGKIPQGFLPIACTGTGDFLCLT